MDRRNFDKLDVNSQVKYVNKKLGKGESLRKISDDLKIQRKTIRLRFRKNNYEFNKEKNKYIYNIVMRSNINKEKEDPKLNIETNTAETQKTYNTNVIQKEPLENKENTLVLQDNIKNDLFEIINAKEDIFKLIKWFHKIESEEKIIEVPELKIDKAKFSGDVKVTTIRIYSGIKDKFQDFIKKFPEFKSQDIYTEALLEFIEKYDK